MDRSVIKLFGFGGHPLLAGLAVQNTQDTKAVMTAWQILGNIVVYRQDLESKFATHFEVRRFHDKRERAEDRTPAVTAPDTFDQLMVANALPHFIFRSDDYSAFSVPVQSNGSLPFKLQEVEDLVLQDWKGRMESIPADSSGSNEDAHIARREREYTEVAHNMEGPESFDRSFDWGARDAVTGLLSRRYFRLLSKRVGNYRSIYWQFCQFSQSSQENYRGSDFAQRICEVNGNQPCHLFASSSWCHGGMCESRRSALCIIF